MSVERSYARLGLFIAIALIVILGTAVLFIQRVRTRSYVIYSLTMHRPTMCPW